MTFNKKAILSHVFPIFAIVLVVLVYNFPVLEGKRLNQHDDVQARAVAQETIEYNKTHAEPTHWTNSLFGGMPTYLINGDYPNSLGTKLGRAVTSILPSPANILFLQMLSMYILLIIMGCSTWLAAIGGIIYGFGCYTLVFIEAGHLSKIIATAFAPLVWAGVVLALRKKYWLGAAVFSLAMTLELYANHLQITYFLAISLLIYVIWEAIDIIKNGEAAHLAKSLSLLALGGILAIMSHSTRLLQINQYSKESTRGKSELTISADGSAKEVKNETGLNREYAFAWSHGFAESLTLLIPSFSGGGSVGGLDKNSASYKVLLNAGADETTAAQIAKNNLPVYWGPQSGTAGPAYAGAIVLFLFVLGLFILKNNLKWYLLVISTLFLALAWGSNFSWFNYLLFDYLPGFNKFRDNKMMLIVMEMFLGVGAILTLKQILDEKPVFSTISKPFFISLGLTGGVSLFIGLLGGSLFNLRSTNDSNLEQMMGDKNLADSLAKALLDDRSSLIMQDGIRSTLFIGLAALCIWLFLRNTIKLNMAIIGIGLLVVIDLFSFNKRYLNKEDFMSKSMVDETFTPTTANQMILSDTAKSYRVADFAGGFWSDGTASYFHKSMGGYHGAKLKRTQELFDFQISKNNMKALDMLNVKYFIVNTDKGETAPQLNTEALGNAWFVKDYKIVANANEEIKALDTINPGEMAVIDKRFENQLSGLKISTDTIQNKIKLIDYQPNKLTYQSQATSDQLALFSEIYYRGNEDWLAYIDGKQMPHLRANYVLRGMKIPTGSHKIEFVFAPKVVALGNTLDLIGSALMVLLVGFGFYWELRKK